MRNEPERGGKAREVFRDHEKYYYRNYLIAIGNSRVFEQTVEI